MVLNIALLLGGDVSCAIFDDLQDLDGRDSHDEIVTSTAARREPLVIYTCLWRGVSAAPLLGTSIAMLKG